MKSINYVYYNIYNWYYKMKLDGRKVDPEGMTAFVFGICIGGWVLLLMFLYLHFIAHTTLKVSTATTIVVAVTFISAGIVSTYYMSNSRYLNIYTDYTTNHRVKNKRKGIILSFIVIFLPLLLFFLAGILTRNLPPVYK